MRSVQDRSFSVEGDSRGEEIESREACFVEIRNWK